MANKRAKPPLRTVAKYFLLQLPGQVTFILMLLLFRQWVAIPAYLAWGLLAFWVGKDIILFPFLWRSYDPDQYSDRFRMIGRNGFALTRLSPEGFVQVRGERWQAVVAQEQSPLSRTPRFGWRLSTDLH